MAVIDPRLPDLLRGSRPLLGMFCGIPSPALIEMCGHAGFDFVIIDNEHGSANFETTEHLIRAARGCGILPVVRTFEADVARTLDCGASAIQVPLVNTAAQAQRIVKMAKYPPVGDRGAAFSTRAAGFGFFGGADHVTRSNEGIAVIVQIETTEAIANLDDILKVPGIDAAFIGPNDLSFSMGHSGNFNHPDVQKAMIEAIRKIAAAGVAPGTLALNPDEWKRFTALGAKFLPMVITPLIANAFRAAVAMKG